ncbi:MAG: sensor histidine kinase [Burkholderiales bacterium]
MQSCIAYAHEATRSGLESGDFLYAAYGASTEAWPAIASTRGLARFVRDCEPNLALVKKLKNVPFADLLALILNWARALRGETASSVSLTDASFDEGAYAQTYGAKPFFMLSRSLARLHLCYTFGALDAAIAIARTARASAPALIGNIRTVLFDFWSALTLAANYARASESERADNLAQMESARRSFEVLARSCPENFLCQSVLLSAEIERVAGDLYGTEGLYERAISYANEANMVQHQALASELYGNFWLRRGNRKIASLYLRQAQEHYLRWGASAKARQLGERHGDLLEVVPRVTNEPVAAIGPETPWCSSAVVNYVYRTKGSVVIAAANADGRFAHDAYIVANHLRSILCLPVIHQGKLGAILYLENDLTSDAFSPERIKTIEILSAQAAISPENARLFDRMRQEIVDRRRVEVALSQTLAELEQLKSQLEEENVYLRREMIANISHDLRTPITLMQGYLDTLLLKGKTLDAGEQRTYLEVAARQSRHLGAMVGELIELAKLDFSGYQLNREPVHLGELAQDVMQMFQLAAQEKGIRLEARIHPELSLAHADMGLIERALENLLGNAIEHTPRGGRISLAVSPLDDRIRVAVSDTGKGIAAEHLPHIFQRFYRVDQSRHDKSGGAGLGLAIVKRIVELHESRINVESKVAEGTTFSFALPAATLHGPSADGGCRPVKRRIEHGRAHPQFFPK